MAFLKHKDGYPWQASSEHNSSRASSISLHSSKTGESRQAISRLVFAFFIAGELAGQTECIAMLAGQAQKGPHDFCSFQDLVCNGAKADMVWQGWHEPWQYSCALG